MKPEDDIITQRVNKLRPQKLRTGIYLTESLYSRLCDLADERGSSMNAVIVALIELGLEQAEMETLKHDTKTSQ